MPLKVNLKQERLNRGMSIRDLAEATGINARTYRRMEAGMTPQPRHAKQLADYLNLKVLELWDEDDFGH